MRVKKLKINGYDVFLYKTKRYSSINMKFLFETDYSREWVYKADLLANYMSCSMDKYRTRKAINDRYMELYSPAWSIDNYAKGEKMLTTASFSFYDPELVRDDYLEEAMSFASEVLFRPNFEGGKLDEKELSRCRDNILNKIADDLLDNQYKAYKNFMETMYPNTYITEDLFGSKEEAETLLHGYSSRDLIECHDSIFNRSCVGLIIMGNVKDEYLKYIEKLFQFKSVKELDENYNEELAIREELPTYVKETDKEYGESILRCAYRCPAKTYKEEMTYRVVSQILSSSGMLLHKVLRDEMKLVYSVTCGYNRHSGVMVLKAYLDKKNEAKALEGFEKVFELLKDKELIESELAKIKEKNALILYTFDENKWNPFSDLYNVSFNLGYKKKKKFKIIESVTSDDVIERVNSMEKIMVHFYEGGKE